MKVRLAFAVFLSCLLIVLVSVLPNPKDASATTGATRTPGHLTHFGSGIYQLVRAAEGADSISDLVRVENCIRNSGRACEVAILSDGSAVYVNAGSSIEGQEVMSSVFMGEVQSGSLMGKGVHVPTEALRQ